LRKKNIDTNFYYFCLAISNTDRARAFNDCHPDREKVYNRIGFASHLEPKQEQNASRKLFLSSPIRSKTEAEVQIKEDEQNEKFQE